MNVGASLSSYSAGFTSFEQSKTISDILDSIFTLPLNEDARVLIFSDVEGSLAIFILKQVKKLLIVNLQEWTVDCVVIGTHVLTFIHRLVIPLFEVVENLFNCPRDYSQLCLILQKVVNISIEAKATHRILSCTLVIIPMLAKHSIGLSRSSLAVRENCRIETSNDIFYAAYLYKNIQNC